MIRPPVLLNTNALTVRNLNVYDHLISNGSYIQCVRWKRKPIWLPTAKSKIFRVPQRPIIPIEDQCELKRLFNNYRTLMKSLMSFFVEKEEEKKKNLEFDTVKINIEKDFEICSNINNQWNKEIAMIRQKRLNQERTYRIQEIHKKLKEKKERDLKMQEIIDANIKKVKEEAATFITSKNIDEAILNALENIIDHNIAIDRDGNFYKNEPKKNESTISN
ncbi:probable 28S ribosomal protein S26, mitochondrial [Apis dorsata]|uniref:probable 28S ribosomal protein S26, mitochondrial n=1 Tax=Apis dorsata TaxID=7462 RepID=UPI0003DF6A86|nr:probable 28S ribosomal protein S26, mitochondrial [Apis dorsata]